jgi:hypothetical protein
VEVTEHVAVRVDAPAPERLAGFKRASAKIGQECADVHQLDGDAHADGRKLLLYELGTGLIQRYVPHLQGEGYATRQASLLQQRPRPGGIMSVAAQVRVERPYARRDRPNRYRPRTPVGHNPQSLPVHRPGECLPYQLVVKRRAIGVQTDHIKAE